MAGLLISLTLALVVPLGVVLSWRHTYGSYSPTSLTPPDLAPWKRSAQPPDGCVGFWRDDGGMLACDTESHWDAEVAVWKYLHWNNWSTPYTMYTGSVDGITLPLGTTLVEHCGAPGQPCVYTELIGHRGLGWMLVTYNSKPNRSATVRHLVDIWNGSQ